MLGSSRHEDSVRVPILAIDGNIVLGIFSIFACCAFRQRSADVSRVFGRSQAIRVRISGRAFEAQHWLVRTRFCVFASDMGFYVFAL